MNDIQFNEPAFEITKSYRDDNGQMFVEGIASTTSIDATGEQMSTEAIAKMAARLVGKPLRSEHGKGWDDKLGEIIKADIVNDKSNRPALWIKARLFDWSSKARDLFSLLANGVEKMGLSVAGIIKPGGIVKEYSSALGKIIPTYRDVEPTEVSVTDHPANLDTWAVAVAKSINMDEIENEFNKDKYESVDSGDFLDAENRKYPIDASHLMPALRYFNHDGQRAAGDYSTDKWATMGRKLAARLSSKTDGKYEYNSSSEKVERVEETKKDIGEEVTNVDKTKLTSKEVSKDVADLVKQFNPHSDVVEKKAPVKEEEVKKVEDKKVDVEKADAASTSTETPTATATPSDGKTTEKDHDQIKQLLSDLGSSLSQIKDSIGETTTEDAGSDEETDSADLMSTLTMCMDKMTKYMGKYGKAVKQPANGTQTATPETTTNTPVPGSDAATAKSISKLEEMIKSLTEKVDSMPNARKGVAVIVEKNLGNDDKKVEEKEDLFKKFANDPEVSTVEFHKWRNVGILPKKYEYLAKKA